MGERTWGKGSVQNVIELEGGKSLLKLTTAAYCRPSGKNIHRFGNEKDDEEWGVRPDKGYDLRLGDAEIVGLMNDRRDRDVVRPRPDGPNGEQPEDKPQQTPQDTPAKDSPAETPADKPAPEAGSDKPAAEAGGETPQPDAGAEPAEAGEPGAEEKPAFVDRQLEMALKYLSTELARAN
jgi:carboxyl-terminal processing protease